MRGISEKDLKDRQDVARRIKDYVRSTLIDELISECKEINPWLPIAENAPKDRPIKIYDTGYGQVCVSWNEFYKCFTDPHGHQYLSITHYQELPKAPL